jgi:MYXO-CTERM domain-containing protein
MSVLHRVALVALLLPLWACDPPETSDEGQYRLDIDLRNPLGTTSRDLLVGSQFHLEVVGVRDGKVDAGQGGLLCVERSGSGVITEVEVGEFVVEAAGEGAVELADPGIACPANDDILAELGPDRWSVRGVAAEDARGRWGYQTDQFILDWDQSPGRAGAFPEAVGRPIEELRVAADSEFLAYPALVHDTGEGELELRWNDPEHELVLPGHYDDLRPRTPMTEGGEAIGQYLQGSIAAGEGFDASVTILGTNFALPPVLAVPVREVASLELVAIYDPGTDEREWGRPSGVLAITRDAEGRRIVGAPVDFELTRGRLWAGPIEGSPDALVLGDNCRARPKAPTLRAATVVARLDDLEASVDLDWIALPDDPRPEPDDPNCVGSSCACASARPPGESAPALLGLFGLGLWLRRRPRADQASSRPSADSSEPR